MRKNIIKSMQLMERGVFPFVGSGLMAGQLLGYLVNPSPFNWLSAFPSFAGGVIFSLGIIRPYCRTFDENGNRRQGKR